MKLLWLFCIIPAVYGAADEFGSPYLKNSRLCHQWNCINTKLGLPDVLPSRDVAEESFRRALPQGPWQDVLGTVLDGCYGNRTRRYINTCPGQALLHCVVDQMIENCPNEHWRKDDACAPVATLAGFKYMFSQSRYNDLEKNLPKEHRPEWFLKNYFDQKCCDLPVIFNSSVIQSCGFSSFITYYERGLQHKYIAQMPLLAPPPQGNEDVVQIVTLNPTQAPTLAPTSLPVPTNEEAVQIVPLKPTQTPEILESGVTDPLDCCDVKEFIQPSWRSECGFHLSWKGHQRLVIANHTSELTTQAPVTTSTVKPSGVKDLTLLPHSPAIQLKTKCPLDGNRLAHYYVGPKIIVGETWVLKHLCLPPREFRDCSQETCVFKKLGIIGESGLVDSSAFWRLLENFTEAHPTWKKAASRVLSKCLHRKGRDYEGSCEINKVLACTFDVLTENCPYKRKSDDSCKHNIRRRGCQISSSKLRPKSRREICLLPPLVPLDHLSECGLESLYRAEYVVVQEPKPKKHIWTSYQNLCQDQLPSTTCLLNKMGVLNKYKFMDYFRMKDFIRQFSANQQPWSALTDFYMSAFVNMPMYGEHCSSQKKLLNVVDAMLMTCPISKRKETPECKKLLRGIIETSPIDNQSATSQKLDSMLKHYNHIYLRNPPSPPKIDPVIRKPPSLSYTRKPKPKPLRKIKQSYEIMTSKKSPDVTVIDIKPVVVTRLDRPLVLAPVYLRGTRPRLDNLYRTSNPYWLRNRLPQNYSTTPASISTLS